MGIAVALLAMLTAFHEVYGRQEKTSTSISIKDGGVHRFTNKKGSNKLDVEYDGRIEFTDDDKAIKSISRGGYLRIRSVSFGNKREILAEPNANGSINYEYYEGRRRADFDAEGKEWLADVLLEVIRTTGIGAEGRVARFYKKGGVDAVLNEIDDIRSDYVSHIYIKALLDEHSLNDNELVKVAGYVPRELDSDHYITEVFKDYGDLFLKDEKTTEAFLSSLERMDSDHYVSVILKKTLREDLSDDLIVRVLDASKYMDSDHYKSTVIHDLLRQDEITAQVINEIVRVTADIDSDHYATLVLRKALDREDLPDEAFEGLIEAVANINSDHYITQTFTGMLNNNDVSDKVVEAIIEKMDEMDSDHYKHVILSNLFENKEVSSKHLNGLLELVEEMDSDHYASVILIRLLKDQDLEGRDRAKVLNIVSNMDSDHYKVTILKEVMEGNLSKENILSVIEVSESIDSDYYRSEVLRRLCDQLGDDTEVKAAFRNAARGIGSDTYYGRVARCVD